MSTQNVDLWVSAGGSDTPFYRFYTDSDGSQELQELVLDTSKSYTFRRLNEANSHPFYISDTGINQTSSDALLITGHGSPSQGITGNQSLKIEFDDSAGDIEELLYYCTSHSSMQGNIQLMDASPSDPIIRGNSLYTIVDGPSWTEAEANSVKLGGHLATVKDEIENNWIYQQYLPQASGNWIGLHQASPDGPWMWSSGEELAYTNWNENEPSNSHGNEDFVHMWGVNNHNDYIPGTWNDLSNSNPHERYSLMEGIAEIPFIRRGDSAYVIVEGPTWEEAEANAVALGGHLVTINDAEENDWLHFQFDIRYTGENSYYYTGFTNKRSGGAYEWISGEDVSYTNWLPGEPNNANGLAVEEYAILGWSGWANLETQWNDVSNRTEFTPSGSGRIPDSKLLGIVEISLAPNNTPIGSPTLIGGFNVGEVIRLDSSAINDADNFEGWTPTYEYSWEVSDDNGTTWTELTSSDATDGDDSYTLTSEEIGKQLRGVVSYLDGYGTNEVVGSDGSLIEQPYPIIRGNSLYSIVEGADWLTANENSKKLGGTLVVIGGSEERTWLSDNIYGNPDDIEQLKNGNQIVSELDGYFVGLSRHESQEFLSWSTPEHVFWNDASEYVSPYSIEYLDGNLILQGEIHSNSDGKIPNILFDVNGYYPTVGIDHYGLAEIPFIRRGDSAYVIVEGPTWEEAEANAVALGGHLVTINDAEENEWILETFIQESPNGSAFIGYSDSETEGDWIWSSGHPSAYTNWDTNNPSNSSGLEDVGTIQFSDGSWNDIATTTGIGLDMRGILKE